MNNTEERIYNTTNAYIGYHNKNISKNELDKYYADVIGIFENELQEVDIELIRKHLYAFWDIQEPKLVPIPVNLKAQEEYNKRFGCNVHFEGEIK